jgi:hypothetical protein
MGKGKKRGKKVFPLRAEIYPLAILKELKKLFPKQILHFTIHLSFPS